MSHLTDFEQLRKKRGRHRLLKRLGILSLVAAVVLGTFFTMKSLNQMDLGQELSDFTDQFRSAEGFPVITRGGGVRKMDRMGRSVVLLTENNFYRIGTSGKVSMNVLHNYFNPAMKVAGSRVLLYDRDGSSLQVDTRGGVLKTMSYPNGIIAADLNDEGKLAVATGSDNYKGEVTVYNKDFGEIFYWFSAENRIIALALAQRNNLMATGTVETSGGMLRSVVNLFRFSSDKETAKIPLDDQILLSLDYKGPDNTLYAVTDKGVYALSGDGVIQKRYDFGGKMLWAFQNDSDDAIVIVLGNYKEQRSLEVYRLDTNLSATGPAIINEHLLDIKCDRENTYVLTDNVLYSYDSRMNLLNTYSVPDAKAIQPLHGEVYFATGEKVDKAVPDAG